MPDLGEKNYLTPDMVSVQGMNAGIAARDLHDETGISSLRPCGICSDSAGSPAVTIASRKEMNYWLWTGGRSVGRWTIRQYWLGHSEAWLSVVTRGGGVVEVMGDSLLDSEPPSVPVDVVVGGCGSGMTGIR